MMEEMYKDWKIKVEEKTDGFVAEKDDHILRNKSLKELKNKIDKFAFKRIPIYYKDYKTLYEGEITSILEAPMNRFHATEIWINYGEEKRRTKIALNKLYKHSETNKKLFEQIKDIEKIQTELSIKAEGFLAQLEHITRTEIGLPEIPTN
jgi:hypothetical protein